MHVKKCNLNFFRHLYHKDFVSGFIKIEPFSCCGLGYDPNLVGAYFLRSFSLHSELSYALHKLNVLWEFWRLFIHNGVKFTQIFYASISSFKFLLWHTNTIFFNILFHPHSHQFLLVLHFFECRRNYWKVTLRFSTNCETKLLNSFFREKLIKHILFWLHRTFLHKKYMKHINHKIWRLL